MLSARPRVSISLTRVRRSQRSTPPRARAANALPANDRSSLALALFDRGSPTHPIDTAENLTWRATIAGESTLVPATQAATKNDPVFIFSHFRRLAAGSAKLQNEANPRIGHLASICEIRPKPKPASAPSASYSHPLPRLRPSYLQYHDRLSPSHVSLSHPIPLCCQTPHQSTGSQQTTTGLLHNC